MVAGGGPGSVTQWFLSNWKLWLAVLIVGGLVVDWLMWVVRWRPYRLLFGRRLRHAPAAGLPVDGEAWDQGVGYYEPETAMDADPSEWTELTLSTLSEIDPGWAGDVVMKGEADAPYPESPFYSDVYEEPPKAAKAGGAIGYWSETPDELEAGASDDAAESPYYADPDMEEEAELPSGDAWAEDTHVYDESIFMPLPEVRDGPAEDEYGTDAYEEPYTGPETIEGEAMESPEPADAVEEDTSPQIYMRPGFWPGALPFAQKKEAPESETEEPPAAFQSNRLAEDEDADLAPAPRRRRRSLREAEPEDWKAPPPFYEPPKPAYAPQPVSGGDRRPRRLVRPASEPHGRSREEKRRVLRTVTGKPAQRRGLFRLTMGEDEPIAGLLPLDLTDPFLPAARPGDPDFEPDEGEEFFTEGD